MLERIKQEKIMSYLRLGWIDEPAGTQVQCQLCRAKARYREPLRVREFDIARERRKGIIAWLCDTHYAKMTEQLS